MSAIWESANWTRQFGIQQTGNRQFGMLPYKHLHSVKLKSLSRSFTSIPILIYEKYKQIYKCASKWSTLGVFSRISRNNYQKNNNIPKHVDSTISKLEKKKFFKDDKCQ